MTAAGFSHTFASLIGGRFMRYIVTVFLDLFISNLLQDIENTSRKNWCNWGMVLDNVVWYWKMIMCGYAQPTSFKHRC